MGTQTAIVVSPAAILEAEERFFDSLAQSAVWLADAVREIARIKSEELWKLHTVPDPKNPEKSEPRFSKFFDGPDGYMCAHIIPKLRDDPRTSSFRSVGAWKNLLRAVQEFDVYGISVEMILTSGMGVILRLERCLEFERKSREIIGLSSLVVDPTLIPAPDYWNGVDELKEHELIDGLIQACFDLDPVEAKDMLDNILGKRQIVFAENDEGDIYALVWYASGSTAVQKFPLLEYGDWPEFLKIEWKARLRLKEESAMFADPDMSAILHKAIAAPDFDEDW